MPEAHVSVAGNSSNHKDGREKRQWKGKEVPSQRIKADPGRSQVKHLSSGVAVLDVEA